MHNVFISDRDLLNYAVENDMIDMDTIREKN